MIDCPSCHQTNPQGASFCIYCGGALPASDQQPPADGTVPGKPASGVLAPENGPGPGALTSGFVVDGKYAIDSVLGEGGMGIVYLATDIHTNVPVVVKAIRSEYAHRPEFRARILAEGRALARIDHQNVVRLNAVVVEPDGLFLVMQFIDGESLDKTVERYVEQKTPMPVDLVLKLFHQVLDGVGAAHAEGVIHRDLKPANILIRRRDAVAKVTDFGIAKAEEDIQAGRGQTKGIIGSLLYMAPEQIKGQRDLDYRVDIYGLGMLLYEMLVGRVPFDAPSEFEIMKLHLEAEIPFISRMRPDVPPYIDAVIHKACAKKREDRFASTAEMAAALRAGQGVSVGPPVALVMAPPVGIVPAPTVDAPLSSAITAESAGVEEPSGRSPLFWAVLFLGLFLLGGGVVGGAWYLGYIPSGEPKPRPAPTASLPVPTQPPPVASPSAADAAPPVARSPLEALVGSWKSDTGRVYNAVLSGHALEFRIHDAKGMEQDGYVTGEERFVLEVVEGQASVFAVKDKVRPALPTDLRYDLTRSRSSCQEVRTEVKGTPLRARYDGTRLTVEVVKIAPDRSMFLRTGTQVHGCVRLREAKASLLQSTLTRR
jgi:serine/threonine-protein kinase